MRPLHDYLYRFSSEQLRMRGRCRVRIYERKEGVYTVLLTEIDSDSGESITSACERIATHIVATKGLNPKTTRWIQHEPAHDDLPDVFEELLFTWDGKVAVGDAQWRPLQNDQVEALTGDSLDKLNGQVGDLGYQKDGVAAHET